MIWVLIVAIIGTLMPTASKGGGCDAKEMLSQLKRHEIQVLLKAGFSVTDVASRSGTSVDSVRRVRAEALVEHADDAAAQ